MKKLIFPLIALLVLLCGCAEAAEQIDVEAILTSVVEGIDWEELQSYAEKGAEALVEKYPSLKVLSDSEKTKELLKDKGLSLMGKLLESTAPETQENAQKLGAIIKILSPELTDEVDAVLQQ